MTEYEIVAKAEMPHQRYRKWQDLFEKMSFEEAVKMDFNNIEKAELQRASLCGSFRYNRRKLNGAKLKTRLVRQSPNVITLYAWKEKVEGKREDE